MEYIIGAITLASYISYNVAIAEFLTNAQIDNNIEANFLSNLKKSFLHPKKTLDEIIELNQRLPKKSLNSYINRDYS